MKKAANRAGHLGSESGGERGFVFERELQQRVAAVQVELGSDVGAVSFNCPVTDKKFGGNLFAGLVFSDQLQDAPLGRR